MGIRILPSRLRSFPKIRSIWSLPDRHAGWRPKWPILEMSGILGPGRCGTGTQTMNTAERSEAKGRLLSRLLLTLLSGGFCALAQTAVSQPSGWQLAYSDDFENGNLADWVSVGMGNLTGTWGIIKDGTNSVLELTNQAMVGLAQQTFSDFHLSMNFRPDDGGLYVGFRRSTTSCAGYWLNAGANNLNLASVQTAQCGTAANQLAAVSSPPSSNSVWHTLDLVAVGASIKIYVDSALQINFTDPSPLVAGSLLFSTSGPGRVDIDNVQIYGPPALSNAEQLVWHATSGPPGGIGYDVRMRMDQPSRMYATDANTGVNISDDNGLTWHTSNAGITARSGAAGDAIPIFTLTVDPHNANVI